MKYLFTLGLTMTLCLAHAQDYQAFISNREYHYSVKVGTENHLYSLKMDSIAVIGTDTVMFNYRKITMNAYDDDITSFAFGSFCLNRSSFVGMYNIKKQNGWHLFIHPSGDTIEFNTSAALGDSWHFLDYANGDYMGAVMTKLYQDSVLGEWDNIKEITLNYYDSMGLPKNSSLNNYKILLSENHGLIRIFNLFHMIGYVTYDYKLVGIERNGICPLSEEQLYGLEVGDYLSYKAHEYLPKYKYRIIRTKMATANSIEYHYDEIYNDNGTYSFAADQVMKFYFTPGKYYLSGQYVPYNANYSGAFNGLVFNYLSGSKAYIKSRMETPFDGNCWSGFDTGTNDTKTFRTGDAIFSISNYDWFYEFIEDGFIRSSKNRNYLQLLLHNDASVGGFGVGVFKNDIIGIDKTSSCNGVFNFTLPDLAYDSVRWYFGDGSSSSALNPTHSYASIGSYELSLQIYSPFQNTLVVFPDSLFYGSNTTDKPISASYFMETGCGGFRFVDHTESVESRLWTLPDGTISSDSTVYVAFDTLGAYTIQLENKFGLCTRTKILPINILSVPEDPVEVVCPLQESGNSLFNFSLNGNSLPSSASYTPMYSVIEDEFLFGCNQLALNNTGLNEVLMFGGLLVYTSNTPSSEAHIEFTGYPYSLWIDYNDDGVFDSSEHISDLICGSGYFNPEPETLRASAQFSVPTTAVLEKPLRMRLVLGLSYSPCDVDSTEMYDFGVIIKGISGNKELESNLFSVHPNPTQDKIHVSFGTATLVNDVNLRILNLVGETVYSDNRQSFSLNNGIDLSIDQFSTGMYVLEIEVEGRRSQQRIIKQ